MCVAAVRPDDAMRARACCRYLTLMWENHENFVIFDSRGKVVDEVHAFIEDGLDGHEGVLVHSLDGVSRACSCSMAYFMRKYHWCVGRTASARATACLAPPPPLSRAHFCSHSRPRFRATAFTLPAPARSGRGLEKTMQFMTSKRPDLCPIPNFYRQLYYLDQRLQRSRDTAAASDAQRNQWDVKAEGALRACRLALACSRFFFAPCLTPCHASGLDSDELLLVNTYVNSQQVDAASMRALAPRPASTGPSRLQRRLTWIDDPSRPGARPVRSDP